ncbi:uncharacterized protein LOC135114911 isoform X2 [Scylla paramamosain]|uniref:uncharacterized protein LOC135114909 isoform X2 n=1 Tax=Scylla paramamosain TaxID=85552 RepID=UPI0030835533
MEMGQHESSVALILYLTTRAKKKYNTDKRQCMKTDEGSPNKKMDNVNTATVLTIISQELDSSEFWELTDQESKCYEDTMELDEQEHEMDLGNLE